LVLNLEQFKAYLYNCGILLMVSGVVFLIPGIVALIFNEVNEEIVFFTLAGIVFAVGIILFYTCKNARYELTVTDAMFFSAFVWLLIPFLGSLPFFLTSKLGFLESYFEAMSGFTATGLTMFTEVETLPKSILFLRSFTEWIGGVGVIVLMLVVIVHPSMAAARLYVSEARTEKLAPTIKGTVREIWWIYLLYTGVGVGLLYLTGMPIFDAINHSMTAIATGGFSVKSGSIGAYKSLGVEVATMFLMLIGMTSFAVHRRLLRGRIYDFLRNVEVRLMFTLILLFSTIVSLNLMVKADLSPLTALRESFFQCISALSGTGFSTVSLRSLDDFTKILLVMLMVVGGGYGSTSSAIKLIRTAIILGSFRWFIRKIRSPRGAIVPVKLAGKVYAESEVIEVVLFTLLYITLLIIGSILMTSLGFSFIDSLFEVASAEGNVGLSVGIASQNLHTIGKIVLILEMWVGRLEILPVIMFLQKIAGKA